MCIRLLTSAHAAGLYVPRDFAPVPRRTSTRVAGLSVGVCHVAFRLLRGSNLLDLNQCVHHLKTGRPTGVAVRTAVSGDGYIDVMSTRVHSETLPNNRGRIVVVVAL